MNLTAFFDAWAAARAAAEPFVLIDGRVRSRSCAARDGGEPSSPAG